MKNERKKGGKEEEQKQILIARIALSVVCALFALLHCIMEQKQDERDLDHLQR